MPDALSGSLSELVYTCSSCKEQFSSPYKATRHINSVLLCKGAHVVWLRKAPDGTLEPAKAAYDRLEKELREQEENNEPVRPEGGWFASTLAAPESSMAMQAAEAPIPSWAEALAADDEPEPEEDDLEPERAPVAPTHSSRVTPFYPTHRQAVFYEAYVSQGYDGTFAQWLDDILNEYAILSGMNVSLFDFSPTDRQRALTSIGA